MTMRNLEIKTIFRQFQTRGTWQQCRPIGSGHIHSTWEVSTAESFQPDFILQKINDKVFPLVPEMMQNIQKVTTHIGKKISGVGREQPGTRTAKVLEVIPTINGATYYTDADGVHWRLYEKVNPGISYDVVPNEKVAYEAGKSFGGFLSDLEDLSVDSLHTVIPGFHSVDMRYEQLEKEIKENTEGRASEVAAETGFAEQRIEQMRIISRKEREGVLPLRITHNDTKLNNILFDQQDRAVCVIDLDTVMPGLSLYDFGDLVRTAANTGAEDEADLDRVGLSLPVFKAISKGFLESTREMLTPSEIELMTLSARYMTFLMGIRFLADYLRGDIYYQTGYPKQNLRRCRAQFQLIRSMETQNEACEKIIHDLARS